MKNKEEADTALDSKLNLCSDSKRRRVVMIYHRFDTGGIETLIARAADYYTQSGLDVILFIRPGDMEVALQESVRVIHFDKYREIFRYKLLVTADSTLIAFDPLGYIIMRHLQLKAYLSTGERSKGHGGIFHPRALFWNGDPLPIRWINQIVFNLAAGHEFFFMSEAVRSATQVGLGRKKQLENPVYPLPVTTTEKGSWVPVKGRKLKVVSVGRLVPFKAYNKAIPKIVHQLAANGREICWDIWGDGDDFELISGLIKSYQLGGSVSLRGVLPYAELRHTLLDYDLFIGMGTAALEAASIGLPTICAIDTIAEQCYGYLYDVPSDCIGEQIEGMPYRSIAECILDYDRLSLMERKVVGERCHSVLGVKSGGSDYNRLLDAPRWPGSPMKELLSVFITTPYLWAVDSRMFRFVFKAIRRMFP